MKKSQLQEIWWTRFPQSADIEYIIYEFFGVVNCRFETSGKAFVLKVESQGVRLVL
jgi:hypothetical protein